MPHFHIERWLAMIDIRGTCFELAWVVFTERKQTSRVHVCHWTNETSLRHGAVTTNIILPTGILSVLFRNFGISYINIFFTIKYTNSNSLCGNTYVNENFNPADISNRYEQLQFLLIIFPCFHGHQIAYTSDECHAWFHLNAASPAAKNTEQVTFTKKNLAHCWIRSTNTARPPDFKSTVITTRPQLALY